MHQEDIKQNKIKGQLSYNSITVVLEKKNETFYTAKYQGCAAEEYYRSRHFWIQALIKSPNWYIFCFKPNHAYREPVMTSFSRQHPNIPSRTLLFDIAIEQTRVDPGYPSHEI